MFSKIYACLCFAWAGFLFSRAAEAPINYGVGAFMILIALLVLGIEYDGKMCRRILDLRYDPVLNPPDEVQTWSLNKRHAYLTFYHTFLEGWRTSEEHNTMMSTLGTFRLWFKAWRAKEPFPAPNPKFYYVGDAPGTDAAEEVKKLINRITL